jgi:histo-blood group ABO system transferase
MEEQKMIGLIVICTGKYDIFLQPLIDSADKWFFKGHKFDIYLLSDKDYEVEVPQRIILSRYFVPHLPFPLPTLLRYKWISQYKDNLTAHNLFYLDVDMLFVNEVGIEILPDEAGLVATHHPGFFHGGWGDNGTHPLSTAYLKPEMRKSYFAGGFQGGRRKNYLEAAQSMTENIDTDFDTAKTYDISDNNGVLAKWHDESHWNKYLKYHPSKKLIPSYCMVEEVELRKKWKIDNLTPRILALKKNHKEIRE